MNEIAKDFDAYGYFNDIRKRNKVLKQKNFLFSRITGIGNLEELIKKNNKSSGYLCVDDTNDGYTYQSGSGYFDRKMYTVFILHRFTLNNMDEQKKALDICRSIYRQTLTKMLRDKSKQLAGTIYLNTNRISFHELEGYAFNGCTGVYMTFNIDRPTNLCYDPNEWDE